jgi:soluble lytic murein transglycosylase-like protein
MAARFWTAVAMRRIDGRAADSALARLAAIPGYDFYAAAARDSLGRRGWPGAVARDSCPLDSTAAPLALARDLLVLAEIANSPAGPSARDDALAVLSRWNAGDARLGPYPAAGAMPFARLAAARLAFAAGRFSLGIHSARTALQEGAALPAERLWSLAPWSFPVTYDSLIRALPERPAGGAPDRALVLAVIWQESKFEPLARSRSNALGLMQLKLPAALDAARWLKEPTPTEARLHDPAVSLRYGVAYLARMLQRFEGRVSLALAAYNAGAGRIPPGWRTWIERGGDALAAELMPYPETRDYVKRILGVRQAYRELDPASAPR